MTDIVTALLLQHIPAKSKRVRDGHKFNCPMCVKMGEPRPDTKQRGGLKLTFDGFVFNCFNCKFATGYSEGSRPTKKCIEFLKAIGADVTQIPIEIRLKTASHFTKKEVVVPTEFAKAKFPGELYPITALIESGFTDEHFDKLIAFMVEEYPFLLNDENILWSPSTVHDMNKRFTLPFYFGEELVGWTSRYYEKKPPEGVPKYMMNRPDNYIFDMNRLKGNTNQILVLEGPTDAKSISGVAMMTNTINDVEAELLRRSGKDIIIVPDMEETGLRLVKDAAKYGFYVSFPNWPKGIKDCTEAVNKMGKLYTLFTIYNSISRGSETEMEARFKASLMLR